MTITKGHIYFAILFAIVFIIIIAWMYRKDLNLHRKYYKGSWLVLLVVLCAVFFFVFLKNVFIH